MNTKLLLLFVIAVFLQSCVDRAIKSTFIITNNSSEDVHILSSTGYLDMEVAANSQEKFEIKTSHGTLGGGEVLGNASWVNLKFFDGKQVVFEMDSIYEGVSNIKYYQQWESDYSNSSNLLYEYEIKNTHYNLVK